MIVIASKRHEEAAFGVGIDGIIPLAPCNDGATVEFNACVGIDGIVGRIDVHGSSIDNDSILAFNAFGSSSCCLHGHGTTVDSDFSLRCNTLSGCDILVLASEAHAAIFIFFTFSTWVSETAKATSESSKVGHASSSKVRHTASEATKSTLAGAVVRCTEASHLEASEATKALSVLHPLFESLTHLLDTGLVFFGEIPEVRHTTSKASHLETSEASLTSAVVGSAKASKTTPESSEVRHFTSSKVSKTKRLFAQVVT